MKKHEISPGVVKGQLWLPTEIDAFSWALMCAKAKAGAHELLGPWQACSRVRRFSGRKFTGVEAIDSLIAMELGAGCRWCGEWVRVHALVPSDPVPPECTDLDAFEHGLQPEFRVIRVQDLSGVIARIVSVEDLAKGRDRVSHYAMELERAKLVTVHR